METEKIPLYFRRFLEADYNSDNTSQTDEPDFAAGAPVSMDDLMRRIDAVTDYVLNPDKVREYPTFLRMVRRVSETFRIDFDIEYRQHYVAARFYLIDSSLYGLCKDLMMEVMESADVIDMIRPTCRQYMQELVLKYYLYDRYKEGILHNPI